jgi:hypothetical protein
MGVGSVWHVHVIFHKSLPLVGLNCLVYTGKIRCAFSFLLVAKDLGVMAIFHS